MFRVLAEYRDFEYTTIDGTIVKVHLHGQGAKGKLKIRPAIARQAIAQQSAEGGAFSRRYNHQDHGADRRTRKPDRLPLLPGQAHDLRGTAALIEGLSCGKLLADRAFDANWLREALAEAGIEAVIPPKFNRRFPAKFDCDTCKWRHLIKNFFGKLKEYRSFATRCCKTDTSPGQTQSW